MFRRALLSLPLLLSLAPSLAAQEARHFTFRYGFTVRGIPAGGTVRIWIPAAHADPFQEVKVVSVTGDLPLKKTREPRFNNEMFYAQAAKADKAELHFEIIYEVVRHERLTLGALTPRLADVPIKDKERKQFIEPDKLAPTTGLPADLAAKAAEEKKTPLEKARAIYEYVLDNMKYDQTSAGLGDALSSASAKQGGCADFHSLFIAMARSQSIPARFETGFAIPERSGEIAGYDCWAEFFEPVHGWVPIDISQAARHPEKKRVFLWSARC
jgi:transglutaminase-like putative cysteine protease